MVSSLTVCLSNRSVCAVLCLSEEKTQAAMSDSWEMVSRQKGKHSVGSTVDASLHRPPLPVFYYAFEMPKEIKFFEGSEDNHVYFLLVCTVHSSGEVRVPILKSSCPAYTLLIHKMHNTFWQTMN
jgi:hypothetical protein